MSRIVEGEGELLIMNARMRVVPIASTIAGSALTLVPIVATTPLLPPGGLLMLLGWRLLRPQIWPLWIGLPLGLIDDLLSGQPLGSAVVLWSLCMILLDATDRQLIWRDYWQEWLLGCVAIAFCLVGGVLVDRYVVGHGDVRVILPQLAVSVLLFPLFLRICAALDRWRFA